MSRPEKPGGEDASKSAGENRKASSAPRIRTETLLELGDALEDGDLSRAHGALAAAGGSVVGVAQEEDPEPTAKRKRKRKPAQVDPSGYPTIASMNPRQVAALVRAAWARCHGNAIDRVGQVAPLRALEARGLVERAPESLSGKDRKGRPRVWYAATAMGALVVLKALLRGNRQVVAAAMEVRA